MPVVEFAGPSVRDDRNLTGHSGRLLNCYREPLMPGGKTRSVLQCVPGMADFVTLPSVFMRAIETIDGVLYAACGGAFYKVVAGLATSLGAIVDSAETTISGHDGFVTVVAGGSYYVWDGTTFTSPAVGAITDHGSVEHISAYTIITERNGKRFEWSALANAKSLPGLNFASASERDDDLLRAVAINGALWLFGTASTEIWYETGQAGAEAFAQMQGATKDIGLKAYGLITKFDGGAFLVGDDDLVRVTSGADFEVVSMPGVVSSIQDSTPLTCIHYEARGHKFCAIVFRDRPAWVFDLATREWHERSEGVLHGAWGIRGAARLGSTWYVARNNGQISSLGETYADASQPLVREAISATLYSDGDWMTLAEVEFFAPVGRKDAGREPVLEFFLSNDGGETYGKGRAIGFGKIGAYGKRMIWRALGRHRQITVKARISDPVDALLFSDARVRLA